MKCGIITVTPNGVKLAKLLADNLKDEITIYGKIGRCGEDLNHDIQLYDNMRDLVKILFYSYDSLIFFTSTGIAVRMLAPYLQHKAQDPAVVVVDEQGRFAISLLSGHLGGANEFTSEVAEVLGAISVITTATDSQGKLAPDTLARKLGYTVYPLDKIKLINGALVVGEKLSYFIDAKWQDKDELVKALEALKIDYKVIDEDALGTFKNKKVFFTQERKDLVDTLCITPKRLVAGVGCRKDVAYELVDQGLAKAKEIAGVTNVPISRILSTEVKAEEKNLLLWAAKHQVPIEFFANDVMAATIEQFNLEESEFVKSQIGIGNVCEASILSYNPRAKIILNKSKFEKVTVSLAWE